VHSAGLLFECTGCVCCPALNQSAPQSSKKVTPRGSRKQHKRVTRNVLGRHSGGFWLLRIRRRLPTMAPGDVLHSKAGSQYSGAGEHAIQQALAQTWSLHAVFALRGSGRLRARTPQPPAVTAARAFREVPISHTVPSAPCRDRTSNVSLRGVKRPTRKWTGTSAATGTGGGFCQTANINVPGVHARSPLVRLSRAAMLLCFTAPHIGNICVQLGSHKEAVAAAEDPSAPHPAARGRPARTPSLCRQIVHAHSHSCLESVLSSASQ
jgi:hypothetical protein